MQLGDALAWLDAHQNLERMLATSPAPAPDLERMRRLVGALGDPQATYPVIHVTGTNGKTSTARSITQLLMAKGLSVGTYTSPHLENIHERIAVNGEPVGDEELTDALNGVAAVEGLLGTSALTWFEIITAAAFRIFSDRPVDIAVVEVGLGGRWDATNVADGAVSVVTNIGVDHVEFLGTERASIAGEKAGIVKPDSIFVLGEPDPDLYPIFEREKSEALWWAGRDFELEGNQIAVGGRLLDLRTPGGEYDGVFLDLHGRYQGHNFAVALAAVEAFFGAPVEPDLVAEAAAQVSTPGRLEVVSRRPLVVLDGAKNIAGASAAASSVAEEFGEVDSTILVVGMLRGKSPEEMLAALGAASARLVVACPPPSPRAEAPAEIVAAANRLGVDAVEADSVPDALEAADDEAGPDDLILVSGSLYVVGAARAHLHDRIA